MSDDLDPDELEDEQERLEAEMEEHERRLRELWIEQQREGAEIRCLEYIECRVACEEIAEEQPTMYPGASPLLN